MGSKNYRRHARKSTMVKQAHDDGALSAAKVGKQAHASKNMMLGHLAPQIQVSKQAITKTPYLYMHS